MVVDGWDFDVGKDGGKSHVFYTKPYGTGGITWTGRIVRYVKDADVGFDASKGISPDDKVPWFIVVGILTNHGKGEEMVVLTNGKNIVRETLKDFHDKYVWGSKKTPCGMVSNDPLPVGKDMKEMYSVRLDSGGDVTFYS